MSPRKKQHRQDRYIRIRSIRKEPPDLKKLARALIALAQARAEAEAQAEHEEQRHHDKNGSSSWDDTGDAA